MVVDVDVKCKSILEENIQKVYFSILGYCTEMTNITINNTTGWNPSSTLFLS